MLLCAALPWAEGCSSTYLVITISMSIFRVGYSSHAARPREQPEALSPASLPPSLPHPDPAPQLVLPQALAHLHGQNSSPMFSGLKAATTSSRGQAFQ